MAEAHKLSDPKEKKFQMQRRQEKETTKKSLKQGELLANARDNKKRNFEDMFATEQQILEDFDTGKLSKKYDNACGKRVPTFRDKRSDA